MLKRITLSHFKQHVDRTIDFGPGINAIRAPNGSGKSNILLAIAYALFGHKALPETLEDTVTYGQPLNKLRVELEFEFAGVIYTISRGKSGAEIKFGRELVTGQTETIKFVERLLGVSADMASKLMLAKQKSVGGALAGGPSVAGKTIEDLAGLGLIDEIVNMIQEQLPSGATSGVEARIALLAAQAVEAVVTDLQPLENALAGAQDVLAADRDYLGRLTNQLDQLDIVQASQILADETRLTAVVANQKTKIEALKEKLAEPLPEAPAAGVIDAVRAKIEAQKNLAAAARVHAGLKAATADVLWDEPRAALEAEIASTEIAVAQATSQLRKSEQEFLAAERADNNATSEFKLELQRLEGRLIQETTCSLCQKDLSDVPEVVQINSDLGKQITTLKNAETARTTAAQLAMVDLQQNCSEDRNKLATKTDNLDELRAVLAADDRFNLALATAGDYVTIDRSVVPARWTWTGPTDEPQDFAGELAKLVEQERTAVAAVALRAGQTVAMEDLQKVHAEDQTALAALQVADAKETIDLVAGLKPRIAAARGVVETAADAVHLAEGALATAKQANEQGVAAAASARAQLAAAQAEMAEMGANNALVKKLRACRPQITDRLWNLVLAAVTLYFSQIRGQHSAITRTDNGFKCNGFPVSGLSGAEEDILGLAVRLSLVKTFLPSVDFMILDEVASACDDQRESAMLGLLSTVGFGQVILVSHADIVDSFADTVITL